MGEVMRAEGSGPLVLRDKVDRGVAIRSNTTTGGSMLNDDEVLALARSASQTIFRFGCACGLGDQAQLISNELQNAGQSRKSKSQRAYEVCRRALELYSRESGIGKLFYIVNSRLLTVKSIRSLTRAEFQRAATDSCEDLADFVRLVWEGLNFEFPEAPRGEVVLYRGVELSGSALESYRGSVGHLFTWSLFASFTESREVAEDFVRA
jgi:hypothetical protein